MRHQTRTLTTMTALALSGAIVAGCGAADDGETGSTTASVDAADDDTSSQDASTPDEAATDTADPSDGGEEVVPMPQVAAVATPDELSTLTGIAWDEASGHFVVVTDSGQVASLDGDAFAAVSVVDSGADSLTDVTVDVDGLLALAPTGEQLAVEVTDAGEVRVGDSRPASLDVEPRGVVAGPELDGPLVIRDGGAGPTVLSIDAGTAAEELQLDDATMTAASSLAVINGQFLASDANAPTVTIFDERGAFGARLGAEGMASIEGITNRDGTFVFVGTDASGEGVIGTYNLTDGQEVDPDPAAGPATLVSTLTATERLPVPDGLTQPSGIAYDGETASMLVNTDQGEFFALSPDLADVRFSLDVSGFDQGNIEDVHVTGPGRAAMVVEDASYIPFSHDGTTWAAGERVAVDALDAKVSAIGFDEASGQLVFIPEDGPDKSLVVTTLEGAFVEEVDIDATAVGLEDLDDYTVAGISHHDGLFHVLSEQYSTVFTMTPEGEVTAALGLADVEEPSGLTVHDGSIWVVLDHEDSEPAPPVVRYPLPPS